MNEKPVAARQRHDRPGKRPRSRQEVPRGKAAKQAVKPSSAELTVAVVNEDQRGARDAQPAALRRCPTPVRSSRPACLLTSHTPRTYSTRSTPSPSSGPGSWPGASGSQRRPRPWIAPARSPPTPPGGCPARSVPIGNWPAAASGAHAGGSRPAVLQSASSWRSTAVRATARAATGVRIGGLGCLSASLQPGL